MDENNSLAMKLVELAAGLSKATVAYIDGPAGQTPFIALPPEWEAHTLEYTLPTPLRKMARVTMDDTASFVLYFNTHCTENSALYGILNPPKFMAVIDDNGHLGAGWRQHTATYACPLSTEWETWTAKNKKQMSQADFAQFIEDNLPDIVSPDSATMLEVSRSLEAKKKVSFASGIRLSNGEVQFRYEEEISGAVSKGQLTVPETFTLGIPVFNGGPLYSVEARLRYRIADSGTLAMWYDLVRPHKVLEHSAKEVWGKIETDTATPILSGTPGI